MNRNILKNYQNFKIYFTFLMIWISIQFGNVVEDFIGYLLVISIGILHGANDLLILSVKEKVKFFSISKKKVFSKTKYFFSVISFKIWGVFGAPGKKRTPKSKKKYFEHQILYFCSKSRISKNKKKSTFGNTS